MRRNKIKREIVLVENVLWHINTYRLFNAKSSLYIYIKNMICKIIVCCREREGGEKVRERERERERERKEIKTKNRKAK